MFKRFRWENVGWFGLEDEDSKTTKTSWCLLKEGFFLDNILKENAIDMKKKLYKLCSKE